MLLPECWHPRMVMVVGRKGISLQQTETGRKHAKCEKNSSLEFTHPRAETQSSGPGQDTHDPTCPGKGTVDSSFMTSSWAKASCTGTLIRFQCPAVLANPLLIPRWSHASEYLICRSTTVQSGTWRNCEQISESCDAWSLS